MPSRIACWSYTWGWRRVESLVEAVLEADTKKADEAIETEETFIELVVEARLETDAEEANEVVAEEVGEVILVAVAEEADKVVIEEAFVELIVEARLEAEEIADKAAGGDGAVLNRAGGARETGEIFRQSAEAKAEAETRLKMLSVLRCRKCYLTERKVTKCCKTLVLSANAVLMQY